MLHVRLEMPFAGAPAGSKAFPLWPEGWHAFFPLNVVAVPLTTPYIRCPLIRIHLCCLLLPLNMPYIRPEYDTPLSAAAADAPAALSLRGRNGKAPRVGLLKQDRRWALSASTPQAGHAPYPS